MPLLEFLVCHREIGGLSRKSPKLLSIMFKVSAMASICFERHVH